MTTIERVMSEIDIITSGSLQVQNLLLLDVIFFVNRFGDSRWRNDEAHRTQHHLSHEEGTDVHDVC